MQDEVKTTTETPKGQPLADAEDSTPWYAIRLFSNNQMRVGEFFKEQGMEYFIPMQYRVYEDEQGRMKRKLRPVVSNLLFVRKTLSSLEMKHLVPFRI